MNKISRLIIGAIAIGILIGFNFMKVMDGYDGPITFRILVSNTLFAFQNKDWTSVIFLGLITLFVGIPIICFFVLAIVQITKALGRPQKIRVGDQVFTAFFFLLFLVFLPKLIVRVPNTRPDWFPDKFYGYLLLLKANPEMLKFGEIIYIATFACIVIFILKILGNSFLDKPVKVAEVRNEKANYCRSCGNTVLPEDRFCRKCGERI